LIALWNRHCAVALIAPVNGGRHEHSLDYRDWLCRWAYCALSRARGQQSARTHLTTILGIVGAFLATFIGQTIGWYRLDQGAGLIGAVVGAVVVLFIWHRLVVLGVIQDPGSRRWL